MNCYTFAGHTAAQYLGFSNRPPDWVKLLNLLSGTNTYIIEWNRNMRSAIMPEGIRWLVPITAGNTGITRLVIGAGIVPYGAEAQLVADGTAAYKVLDGSFVAAGNARTSLDKREANVPTGVPITTWTLDTAASGSTACQGHFNSTLNASHCGIGSVVIIRETSTGLVKRGHIVIYGADATVANAIDLSTNIASGRVEYIGPQYDFVTAPSGLQMPAGIKINETTLNASAEPCQIQYGWFDSPAFPD